MLSLTLHTKFNSDVTSYYLKGLKMMSAVCQHYISPIVLRKRSEDHSTVSVLLSDRSVALHLRKRLLLHVYAFKKIQVLCFYT